MNLIDKLIDNHTLPHEEFIRLLLDNSEETCRYLNAKAVEIRKKIYSNHIFIRGLIEISNFCKNDCYYCGIRRSNKKCERYRLNKEEILSCCETGYPLGFRTFVLQGGEDPFYTDEVLCKIVSEIKNKFPDCAVTLSLGERSKESYQKLFEAGADRYLLRHETINEKHYTRLHPENMTLQNRVECLNNLKETGFQTGCGIMVGSPYQTIENIAEDLVFISEFKPEMVGVGPFIPHKDTPFAEKSAGNVELTCRLLSIIRIMLPNVLLPATTALGSLEIGGREKGILCGANVVMPNLSPVNVREKYMLYNNKLSSGAEAGESLNLLKASMSKIGYEIVTDRGDFKK